MRQPKRRMDLNHHYYHARLITGLQKRIPSAGSSERRRGSAENKRNQSASRRPSSAHLIYYDPSEHLGAQIDFWSRGPATLAGCYGQTEEANQAG
jgi:hypothetical protein